MITHFLDNLSGKKRKEEKDKILAIHEKDGTWIEVHFFQPFSPFQIRVNYAFECSWTWMEEVFKKKKRYPPQNKIEFDCWWHWKKLEHVYWLIEGTNGANLGYSFKMGQAELPHHIERKGLWILNCIFELLKWNLKGSQFWEKKSHIVQACLW